jgi:hypothetical protein
MVLYEDANVEIRNHLNRGTGETVSQCVDDEEACYQGIKELGHAIHA